MSRGGGRWKLVVGPREEVLVDRLRIADTYFARLRGMQFRPPLARGEGLLLVPCSSIHTLFVRGPMDVVYLDRSGAVLGVHHDVKPWRPFVPAPRKTYATLELPPGAPHVHKGASVLLVYPDRDGVIPPSSVRFLGGHPEHAVVPVS